MMTEGQQLYMKTGVPVHPMSTLTKLLWLREDEPDLFSRTAYFADIKAYLSTGYLMNLRLICQLLPQPA